MTDYHSGMGAPVQDWATNEDPDGPYELVCDAVSRAKKRQTYRVAQDAVFLAMYGGLSYGGYQSRYADGTGTAQVSNQTSIEAVENVVRECVQTILNKFLANKPAPKVYTEDGDWEARNEAENLEQWCLGMLQKRRVYQDVAARAALSALLLGTGCVYVAPGPGDRIVLEWAPTWELWVDPAEAYYGEPRNLYRERAIPRDVLRAQYPDSADDIESAAGPQQTMLRVMNGQLLPAPNETDADLVRVIEAWRLPTEGGAEGRHVVVCSTCTLHDEEYAHESFPFAFLRYQRRPVGFWGQGVVEELAATQATLNAAQLARFESIRLMSQATWFIPRGCQVVESQLANEVGRIIEYTGPTPPTVVAPEPVGAGLMQLITDLRSQMLNQCGISQAAVASQKPAGLDSGKALRTYYDMQSERLQNFLQGYPDLIRDICDLMIRAACDGAGESVVYVGDGKSRRIKWSDLHYDPEQFIVQLAPVSALSSSIEGRIQDVQDLMGIGAISDPRQALELLNLPDTKHLRSVMLSPQRLIEEICEERILKRGEAIVPEPHWDLAYGLQYSTVLAQRALLDEAPPERIDMLTAFAAQCQALAAPPPAPPPPAGPGPADMGATPPGAGPGAPGETDVTAAVPGPGPVPAGNPGITDAALAAAGGGIVG